MGDEWGNADCPYKVRPDHASVCGLSSAALVLRLLKAESGNHNSPGETGMSCPGAIYHACPLGET